VEAVKQKDEDEWKARTQQQPQLQLLYATIKSELTCEPYLTDEGLSLEAKRVLLQLRSGVNDLRIDTGRREKPKLPREKRICLLCANGVEDEKHFMFHCSELAVERQNMMQEVQKKQHVDWAHKFVRDQARTAAFIGVGLQNKKQRRLAASGLVKMMRARHKIMKLKKT
jgi:hypothetical protein